MIKYEIIKKVADKNGLDISKYDPKELALGIEVEKEHAINPKTDVVNQFVDLIKIAMAHLDELPDYYTRLDKMENENKIREIIRQEIKKFIK